MTKEELRQYLIDEIDLQKEFLNQHEVGFIREDEEERLSALETALNLIEKQQKEIEELKGITKTYDSYIGEKMPLNSKIIIADREYFMNGTFVNKFISKDKIRYYYYKICASINHFESKNDNNIVLRIKKYLEELLKEN